VSRPPAGRWENFNKARGKERRKREKIIVNGIPFSSKTEADRYEELLYQQRQGLVSNIECQVKYRIEHPQTKALACVYIADFRYIRNGEEVTEDVKGGPTTDTFNLKRRLMRIFNDIHVVVVRRVGRKIHGRYRWMADKEMESWG
jgi:hypothetical protein